MSVNLKLINADNLRHNISLFKDKKICLMVKANAYGHGLKEVVEICDDLVDAYGVVSEEEGAELRKLTKNRIIIFSIARDFLFCKSEKLEFMIENEEMLWQALEYGCKNLLHLAINSGMNRFGTKSEIVLKNIDQILKEKKINLKSIYTHFSQVENERVTKQQFQNFLNLRNIISQDAPVCLGGSGARYLNADMIRLGIAGYGYGNECEKVMQIRSKIIKILYVKKGEYVGYGKKFRAKTACFIGLVPIGYGDGLLRNLSQKFYVKIDGKKFRAVGNICMDSFFVKVDESVHVGDEVEVIFDASYLARRAKTIPYEILTNFSKLRGEVKVVRN